LSTYQLTDEISIHICDNNFTEDILDDVYKYKPLSYLPNRKRKYVETRVEFVQSITMRDAKIAGIYSKRDHKIFINAGILELSQNCSSITNSESALSFSSKVVVHEMMHFIVLTKYDRKYCEPIALRFYRAFWKEIIEYRQNVSKVKYNISIDDIADVNYALALTPDNYRRYGKATWNLSQLISILAANDLLTDSVTIMILNKIAGGKVEQKLNYSIERAFEKAYREIYNSVPVRTKFGQELIDLSEIFSTAAQTRSAEAEKVIKHMFYIL
jgi:hypothetical protein